MDFLHCTQCGYSFNNYETTKMNMDIEEVWMDKDVEYYLGKEINSRHFFGNSVVCDKCYQNYWNVLKIELSSLLSEYESKGRYNEDTIALHKVIDCDDVLKLEDDVIEVLKKMSTHQTSNVVHYKIHHEKYMTSKKYRENKNYVVFRLKKDSLIRSFSNDFKYDWQKNVYIVDGEEYKQVYDIQIVEQK